MFFCRNSLNLPNCQKRALGAPRFARNIQQRALPVSAAWNERWCWVFMCFGKMVSWKLNKIRQLVSWVQLVHRIKFKYCKLFLTSELHWLCTWASRLQKENRLRAIHSVLQFIFFECNNTTYTIKASHKRNTLRCITQLPCMYLRYGWVRGTK